jgi:hypothetical protein
MPTELGIRPVTIFWAYDYSGSLTTYATLNTLPDQMNYDEREMATTAVILNQTYSYLQATDSILKRSGYTQAPDSVTGYARIAINYSETAVSLFSQPNPNYENASVSARVALMKAQSAYATAVKLPQAITTAITNAGTNSAAISSTSEEQTQSYAALVGVVVFMVSVSVAAYGLWQRRAKKMSQSQK